MALGVSKPLRSLTSLGWPLWLPKDDHLQRCKRLMNCHMHKTHTLYHTHTHTSFPHTYSRNFSSSRKMMIKKKKLAHLYLEVMMVKLVSGQRYFFLVNFLLEYSGFPGGSNSKESACNVGDLGSIPGLEGSSGGGHGNLLQYSCLQNPHRQRSPVGCRPWGCKESDMTEQPSTARHIVALQCCVRFFCTVKWISCRYTYV